jgi:hypothetical protein
MDASQAWQSVLGQLQMEMPRASFDTWVRDTEAVSLEDGTLTISTRNDYARDWLESRLRSTVSRMLVGILNQSVKVEFVVRTPDEGVEIGEEESESEVTLEPVQWLDYDQIVQPHKQVVVKGYLRRLGMEIGPKAIWLYIGFHQAAWLAHSNGNGVGMALHSSDVMRFSGLSFGAFWRALRHKEIQSQLRGLVQRIDPLQARKYHRGRDGRPHRTPVHYQVCMTPRLTRADAQAVYSRLKTLLDGGVHLPDALQELISVEDITELLVPAGSGQWSQQLNTVMDIARLEAGNSYSAEIEQLAQQLHRRIINSLGDIHITHYFITRTIHEHNLTPAQAWLITMARDMAYLNSRTGERREAVTFRRGFQEMAELVGSSRYKTVQAWFNPQWEKQCRGGNITRFLSELDIPDTKAYTDMRTETMARAYRVLLDEPLDASGSNKADANGSISLDADGSNSRTRMEGLLDASGSNMVDANGTALNTFKHPLNTQRNNTSSTHPLTGTRHDKAAGAATAFWEIKTLLKQNNVHPKVQRELLDANASVHSFVAWILFAASPQGRRLSDPLGYAISQLRQEPSGNPPKLFHKFASLPPAELRLLIDSTPADRFEFRQPVQHPLLQAWKKAMGSHNPRLAPAREILFGESEAD